MSDQTEIAEERVLEYLFGCPPPESYLDPEDYDFYEEDEYQERDV